MNTVQNSRTMFPKIDSDTNLKTRAARELGILLRYLRQSKDPISLEEKVNFRKKLPHLPDESELEPLTQEAFTQKLVETLGDREKLSYGTLQRWEHGKSMPEALNLLRIAKLAGMSILELFAFMFPTVDLGVPPSPPERDLSLILKEIRRLENIVELGEIILVATELIMATANPATVKLIPKKETKFFQLSEIQSKRLALLLKKSLELDPGKNIPVDFRNDVLKARSDMEHSKSSLERLAEICHEIKAWDEDEPWIKPDVTYKDRWQDMLDDLENKPSLQSL